MVKYPVIWLDASEPKMAASSQSSEDENLSLSSSSQLPDLLVNTPQSASQVVTLDSAKSEPAYTNTTQLVTKVTVATPGSRQLPVATPQLSEVNQQGRASKQQFIPMHEMLKKGSMATIHMINKTPAAHADTVVRHVHPVKKDRVNVFANAST